MLRNDIPDQLSRQIQHAAILAKNLRKIRDGLLTPSVCQKNLRSPPVCESCDFHVPLISPLHSVETVSLEGTRNLVQHDRS